MKTTTIKKTLRKAVALSLMGLTFGACAVDQESAEQLPPKQNAAAATLTAAQLGQQLLTVAAKAAGSKAGKEFADWVLPASAVDLSDEALAEIKNIVQTVVEDERYQQHRDDLGTVMEKIGSYHRLDCREPGTASDAECSSTHLGGLHDDVEDYEGEILGLYNYFNSDSLSSGSKVLYSQHVQLAAAGRLALLAELHELNLLSNAHIDTRIHSRDRLCTEASRHLSDLKNLEDNFDAYVEGYEPFTKTVNPPPTCGGRGVVCKPTHRACFNDPEGEETCASNTRTLKETAEAQAADMITAAISDLRAASLTDAYQDNMNLIEEIADCNVSIDLAHPSAEEEQLPMPREVTALGRTLTVNDIYINGSSSNTATVAAGDSVTIRLVGDVVDSQQSCDTCITQFYARLNDNFSLCLGTSTSDWEFDESITFTAPSSSGTYYINPASSWEYECVDATNASTELNEATTLAVIIVE